MINMLNLKLKSVKTTGIELINKRILDEDEIRVVLSRRCRKSEHNESEYIGDCSVELLLVSEENMEKSARSFYIMVSLTGIFTCDEPKENITNENLHTAVVFELLPHVRACLASTMTIAGMAPYLIPNSLIPELS